MKDVPAAGGDDLRDLSQALKRRGVEDSVAILLKRRTVVAVGVSGALVAALGALRNGPHGYWPATAAGRRERSGVNSIW